MYSVLLSLTSSASVEKTTIFIRYVNMHLVQKLSRLWDIHQTACRASVYWVGLMTTTAKLWQLYDEQGRPLTGQGASKQEVFRKGLLHGSAHVWIWRKTKSGVEVLLQKRSAHKRTWPNRLDISAAGHIYLGNKPLGTAVHETNEEIGLKLADNDLELFAVHRAHLIAPNGSVENEFQFLFLHHMTQKPDFALQMSIVDSLVWMSTEALLLDCADDTYVDHGMLYYQTLATAVANAAHES